METNMKLRELIEAVKEKSLTKEQLEAYRDDMSNLFALMQLEIADLEKEEALFMDKKTEENSVAEMKVYWKATPSGQRLIELKRYCLATKEMLNSLKSRLFQLY